MADSQKKSFAKVKVMIDKTVEGAMTGIDQMPQWKGITETGDELFTWMKVVMGEGMIATHINITAPVVAGDETLAAEGASAVAAAFFDMTRAASKVPADIVEALSFASDDSQDVGMGNGKPKGKKGKLMKGKAKGKKKKGQGNEGKGKDHYTGL